MENTSNCPVCYEELNEDNKVILAECSHEFCEICIIKWLIIDNNKICPLDRGILNHYSISKENKYFESNLSHLTIISQTIADIVQLVMQYRSIGQDLENVNSNDEQFEKKISAIIQKFKLDQIENNTQECLEFFYLADPIDETGKVCQCECNYCTYNLIRYSDLKQLAYMGSIILSNFRSMMTDFDLNFQKAIRKNSKIVYLRILLGKMDNTYIEEWLPLKDEIDNM